MTVPSQPADAEILAEYQRRIDDGDPIPSQRSLVERYGMGFPRARRLVDELKRRKATATVTAVAATVQREAQTEGDGAVAEVAGELIDRIHARTEAVADAVERQTNGAVRHEAAAPHRTAERAPAAPERPRNGAVGAVRPSAEPTQAGAPPVELHRTGPRPVHRNGAPAPQAHRLPVQGAPVDGAASASEADQPAEQATPSSTTAVGAPIDGEPAPTSAPPALAALERVEADTPADDTSRAEIGGQHANGRVFRGPVVHTVSAQMPGVSEADQSAEEATAPSAAEVATPVDGEPAPTAPQAHRSPVQGAPPRTAGGAERTGSEDQTGAPAPPVHRPAPQGAPPRTAGGAERTGSEDQTGAAAPQGAPLAGAAGAAGAVRPGALVIVLWVVGAAVAAAAVTRAVQTPIGQRVWGWLAGAVGADAVTVGVVAGGAGLLAAVVGVGARMVSRHRAARGERAPLAPRAYLVSAIAFMGLSVDTTLRFFRQKLGITDWWELALIFGGMELGLLACGIAMREAVRRGDPIPASAQTVAWGLAALAGTTGLLLSGWPGGLVRAAGPALAMVMLHLALGVELRHAKDQAEPGALARVAAELRERALSRLGLADEGRTAVARSRRRAARRAARLALQEGSNERQQARRDRRLQEALAKADVAGDAEARRVFLDEVEVLRAISSVDGLVKTVSALGQDT